MNPHVRVMVGLSVCKSFLNGGKLHSYLFIYFLSKTPNGGTNFSLRSNTPIWLCQLLHLSGFKVVLAKITPIYFYTAHKIQPRSRRTILLCFQMREHLYNRLLPSLLTSPLTPQILGPSRPVTPTARSHNVKSSTLVQMRTFCICNFF